MRLRQQRSTMIAPVWSLLVKSTIKMHWSEACVDIVIAVVDMSCTWTLRSVWFLFVTGAWIVRHVAEQNRRADFISREGADSDLGLPVHGTRGGRAGWRTDAASTRDVLQDADAAGAMWPMRIWVRTPSLCKEFESEIWASWGLALNDMESISKRYRFHILASCRGTQGFTGLTFWCKRIYACYPNGSIKSNIEALALIFVLFQANISWNCRAGLSRRRRMKEFSGSGSWNRRRWTKSSPRRNTTQQPWVACDRLQPGNLDILSMCPFIFIPIVM